jgi:hypothetical protein
MAIEYLIRYKCNLCGKRSPEQLEEFAEMPIGWEKAGNDWSIFGGIPEEDPRFSVKHFCIHNHREQYEKRFGKLPDYNVKR